MTRLRTITACDKSAAKQFAPFNQQAEDRAVEAWQACERVRHLEPRQLRANFQAILECRRFIEQAIEAAMQGEQE